MQDAADSPDTEAETEPETEIIDLDDGLVRLDIEEAITGLDGIEAVRLVPGTTRPVDELHVVVAPERDPKHTARDLQSLLLARFGVDVDRRVISVVRLGEDAGKRLHHGLPRVTLDAVHLTVRSEETSVAVELARGDETLRGTSGPVTDASLATATAEATLEALEATMGTHLLRLLGVELTHVGDERVALVAVEASDGRQRDTLTGSATVRRNEADGVARAVLDATNRLRRG